MPTQIDTPIGLGSPENWWFEGATSKIAAVQTNDGDSSFIYADSGGADKTILFSFPLLAGVTDPVTSASIVAWSRVYRWGGTPWGGSGQQCRMYWNSVAQTNLADVLPDFYITLTYTVATPTLAAVNGFHGIGIIGTNGPGNKYEVWCSQYYRSVTFDYVAPGGGTTQENNFAHLASAIVGAIGASLLLREMPALARAIFRRTRVLIQPREYEMAFREITAMKRPVFV
jgi:hypothetical protein